MKPLFSLLLTLPIACFAQNSAQNQSNAKDRAVVQTPDGTKYEVKVPRKAVESVTQTGQNSYTVKVNRQELKKIEVNQLPPDKK